MSDLTEQQMYEIYREDRIRQVKTTKDRHGKDFYSKIGAMKKKRYFDDPKVASDVAKKAWAKRKEKDETQS